MSGTIFFLTDFGQRDEFVGVVHAVICKLAPSVKTIDLCHEVPAFDVAAGAAMLERAADHLGAGVILAVVDPGVGGTRRPIALEVDGAGPRFLVGPDNGLLLGAATRLGGVVAAVELDRPAQRPAVTFDGRDLFGPAAARLANGAALLDLGQPIEAASLVRLAVHHHHDEPLGEGRTSIVRVTWVDRYGNVQLNRAAAARPPLGTVLQIAAGSLVATGQVVTNFSALERHGLGVLVDANGCLALVVREGSAAETLGVAAGDVLTIRG